MSRRPEDSPHESTPVRNNKARHITHQGQDRGHTDSPLLLNSRDGVVSGTTRQCKVVCWGLSRTRQHRDFDRTPVLCHATQRNATTSRHPRKLLHIAAPWHQNVFPFYCTSNKKKYSTYPPSTCYFLGLVPGSQSPHSWCHPETHGPTALHAAWNAPRPPSDPAVNGLTDMTRCHETSPGAPGTRCTSHASARQQGCGAFCLTGSARRHHHHSGRDSGAADPADPVVIDINPRVCGADNHGHWTFRTDRPRFTCPLGIVYPSQPSQPDSQPQGTIDKPSGSSGSPDGQRIYHRSIPDGLEARHGRELNYW
ncbi:hypothetical protein F5X68DRAFT_23396 [Plectosphaerella plurivora]|uniref:Uncharacterized protein n=1 Tax=Plectosphaerella plurivora TaxID=936078 RepID=A0A9P8V8I2_9PEZI|nr:hypothetical protein F5X68DRAFT_23396 [Plectosphaerella plurivora]